MFHHYHRGLFVYNQALNSVKLNMLNHKLAKISFESRLDDDSEGFEHHPYAALLPNDIFKLLRPILDRSNLKEVLGTYSIQGTFVLKHVPNNTNRDFSMDYHHDIPTKDQPNVLSVIFTFKTDDCEGGSLSISNRADGTVSYSKDAITFSPAHNSFYAFHGSYAEHGVMPITRGIRYAIVMFFTSSFTFAQIQGLWNNDCTERASYPFACTICGKRFETKRTLRQHNKRGTCAKKVVKIVK